MNCTLMLALNEKQLPVKSSPPAITGVTTNMQPAAPPPRSALNLKELWRRLRRQSALFWITLLTILALTALLTWMLTPKYRAVSTLQIEKEGVQVVDFGELNKPTPDLGELDPFFRTQYEQLKSRELAERIISKMNLESRLLTKNFGPPLKTAIKERADFMLKPVKAGITDLVNRFSPADSDSGKTAKPDYVTDFLEHLYVEPVEKTHLVKVFYESPDPELSADIVNTLVGTFIRETLTEESETDTYAQTFLEMELEKARTRLTNSEEAMVAYARDNDILEVNNSQLTQEQKLTGLNAALSTAEQRRIEADSQLRQARQHNSVGGILSNPVIVSLKSQLSGLEADYQNKSRLFKPAYPDMQQLAGEIQIIRRKIVAEVATLKTSLEAEQAAAVNQENRLKADLNDYKNELVNLRDRGVEYNALKRDVDTNRKLYDDLLKRMKEISVAAGVSSSNVRIVDKAKPPVKPFRPNKLLNMLIGLLTGLMLATGLALLRESFSESLNSSHELQAMSGLPVLGRIPYVGKTQQRSLPLVATRNIGSPAAEAYRIAATNLKFATPGNLSRIFLMTSVNPAEGKSTSSINLALSKAQMGNKVLLIDADLRRPSLHTKMRVNNHLGLSEYLHGDVELSKVTQHFSEVRNTYVITAGLLNLDPVEAISSERMAKLIDMARQYFDITIIDAPPVTGFADALLLAGMSDATVVVTREDHINRQQLEETLLQLQRIKQNVLGFLVVKARQSTVSGRYYERYSSRETMGGPVPSAHQEGGLNLAKG